MGAKLKLTLLCCGMTVSCSTPDTTGRPLDCSGRLVTAAYMLVNYAAKKALIKQRPELVESEEYK